MSTPFREVSLPRPVRLPESPPPAIPAPEALAAALRGDSSQLELSSRRVRVLLTGVGGLIRLEGDGSALLASLTAEGAAGANLLLGPRTASRECYSPGGGLRESVLIPEALPGAVVQWTWTGAAPSAGLRLSAELLPAAVPGEAPAEGGVALHRAPGLLWIARDGAGVLLHAPGQGSVPEVRDQDGRLLLTWTLDRVTPGDPVTLLVQGAPPEGAWPSLTALAGVDAHHLRGEAAARGEDDPGLALETGVDALDTGTLRVRGLLRDRLLTPPGSSAGLHPLVAPPRGGSGREELAGAGWLGTAAAPAWFAMGALAAGEWEAARAGLTIPPGDDPRDLLPWALAMARWTAWTGDSGPLQRAADRLAGALEAASASSHIPPAWTASVRRAVAAAAEAAGLTQLASTGPGAPASMGGRRLPVLGAAWEALPLPLADGRANVPVAARLAEALGVREGLEGAFQDPGMHTRAVAPFLAGGLVHGVMGAVPDATYGRLTLSPLLPPHWTRFRARGIRCGEGELEMAFRREGPHVRWTLRPGQGSVPLMVIFEPWQPLQRLRSLRVDGEDAELDVDGQEEWSRVRLQLPVDRERVVEAYGE